MRRVIQWATGNVGRQAAAVIGGREALTIEHITRLSDDQAPSTSR